jgi:hypothetical protein
MKRKHSSRNWRSSELQPTVVRETNDQEAIIAAQADVVTGIGVHSLLFIAAAQDDAGIALLTK